MSLSSFSQAETTVRAAGRTEEGSFELQGGMGQEEKKESVKKEYAPSGLEQVVDRGLEGGNAGVFDQAVGGGGHVVGVNRDGGREELRSSCGRRGKVRRVHPF